MNTVRIINRVIVQCNVVVLMLLVCNRVCTSSAFVLSGESPERLEISRSDDADAEHAFELTQALNLQRQERVQRECEWVGATTVNGQDDNGVSEVNNNNNNTDHIHHAHEYSQHVADIPDDQLEHLLIDEKHKFLYCYVPKVSEWFSLLLHFII